MEIRTSDILQWTVMVIAFVAAIVNRRSFGPVRRYFEFYMFFVLGIEVSAILLMIYGTGAYGNALIYNVYDVVTYIFFLRWFYQIIPYKKLVIAAFVVYGVLFITSLFIENYLTEFSNINAYSGALIILILTNAYYVSLLKKEEIVAFTQLPSFWIASALLIFNTGYLPIQLLVLAQDSFDLFDLSFVLTLLVVVLYGCFLKAFLCPQEI